MTLAERIEKFNNLMGDIVPPEVKKDLLEKGFFTAPASTKYHGNYEGGLFDHSYMVARYLKKLTEECRLDWQNPRSPLLVGMFHDLCKIDNYQHPVIAETLGGEEIRDDSKWEYAMDTLLKGHGDKSVMVLAQYFKLTEEEIMCIRYHMGAFCDKSEWKQFWWNMIQLLPSSFNQKRTVTMTYENLLNMLEYRRGHKLDEWRMFCDWILTLPHGSLLKEGVGNEQS